ncbi:beta-carotene ketolase [Gordonia araii NBRC 100433]|uniref:Pyridine nucleotide-disulfide oxidoreductase domain-containing protein 2 n=1 Tax=Gordonia araii NBRC 100433 TaxID=1073574 RepID=G7H7P0_9ACTN|nr:NAD(P)/FAD-dependent oxidoreductase [Gordonia araii]NNG97849.1 NAD(P)/FAD-dependent oxidoreductase [Gordonia araii NBRC 100433]GAB11865.1 beta-carotene ketolase [Gordonia araii NBRC 100433]
MSGIVDVAVVGAGHNGLIAAAYLAAAGRSVCVIERDTVLGGAVSTVERFPGYAVDRGSSAHLMIRHTPILAELDLHRYGLRYAECDPWAFAPAENDDDEPIVFHHDLAATCASIERVCGKADADAYASFVADWQPRARATMAAFGSEPTPTRFAAAFAGSGWRTRSARRSLVGRRIGAFSSMSQEMLNSGDALLDRWFGSERLKSALSWFGAQSGPPTDLPGTAPMVGFAALMHDIPPGRAIGGSGALTTALVARLTADGAQIATGAPVAALRRTGSGWEVVGADGHSRRCRHVIAACHISTTLDLLAAGGYPTADLDRWRRAIVVGNGIGMAVRLGTTGLPRYRNLPADLPAHGVHSGLGLLTADRAHLRRAHAASLVGELPQRPVVLPMGFSALDPTIAPDDRHLVNVWAQWHPYRLSGGRSWATSAQRAADAVVAEIDRFAPGFSSSIEHCHIQTPADLEEELGLRAGNIMHVEMTIDQMFGWRPHPDFAGRTVPGAPGLVLAGASTHPGGGVTGTSGRLAARRILRSPKRSMS